MLARVSERLGQDGVGPRESLRALERAEDKDHPRATNAVGGDPAGQRELGELHRLLRGPEVGRLVGERCEQVALGGRRRRARILGELARLRGVDTPADHLERTQRQARGTV